MVLAKIAGGALLKRSARQRRYLSKLITTGAKLSMLQKLYLIVLLNVLISPSEYVVSYWVRAIKRLPIFFRSEIGERSD